MTLLVWIVGLAAALYVIGRARKPKDKTNLSSIFDKHQRSEGEDWNK